MHLSINPLSGKRIDSRRRLVFDEQRIGYVSLAKGEKLIRDPLNLDKLSIGQKLLFDPLQGKYIVAGYKLGFDPLQGKFITLQKGEKLRYDPLGCKFVVVSKKRLFEK
ncbi:unnamed protein product [marine sediment metagenome]|uniref:Uncharacterized protein n=1 Tax=marine sediment metagenome TaxID=412755 RepID=X1UZR5_9ZZZZ